MMTGAMANAWLAQQQPAMSALLRQRLGACNARAEAAEAAHQLVAQFLQQLSRQQELPLMAASDLEQAGRRSTKPVDATISNWIEAAGQHPEAAHLATAVAGPVAGEIAHLMQSVVAILLDPTAAMKSA